ncbi:MAG: hypothetical protein ACI9P9_000755 [Patescibacteria group bacterium]|jgi:hypothetical protein
METNKVLVRVLKGGMNNMEKRYVLSGFAFMTVLLLGFSMVSAMPGFGGEESEERSLHKEALRAAIEAEDYDAWAALMAERVARLEASITTEHFTEVIERHSDREAEREAHSENREALRAAVDSARESGDFSEVRELREESGFNLRSFFGFGRGR